MGFNLMFNPLNTELNPISHLLALFGAHHIFHVSRISVKGLIDKIKLRFVDVVEQQTENGFMSSAGDQIWVQTITS